jgi:hypothetical protein
MNRRSRLCAPALLVIAAASFAHDGGFGHSRRTLFIASTATGFTLEYRVVLNRDEALAEMALMDADGDGQIDRDERTRYFETRGKKLAGFLLAKTGDGEAIPLTYTGCALDHALAQTYTFTMRTAAREATLEDRVFPHKPGMVQVRHGDAVKVEVKSPTNLAHAERVVLSIRRTTP